MKPVLQSTNERPAPCRHNIWVEQPPSAELPARCAFYISCFGHTQPTPFEPALSAGRGTFSRLRSSFCERPVADFAGSASPVARREPIASVVRSFEPDKRHLTSDIFSLVFLFKSGESHGPTIRICAPSVS